MTSVGLSLFNYQDHARSNKHKIGGVVSLCRLKLCFSLHKNTTPLHQHTSNQSSTPTHSRKLLKMNVLAFETCWAKNKASDISWSVFIQLFQGLRRRIEHEISRNSSGEKVLDQNNWSRYGGVYRMANAESLVLRASIERTGICRAGLEQRRCCVWDWKYRGADKSVARPGRKQATFPTFYGNRKFITTFTTVHHLSST